MTPTDYDEDDIPTYLHWGGDLKVEKGGVYSLLPQHTPGTYIIQRDVTWRQSRNYNTFVSACADTHIREVDDMDYEDFIINMWRAQSREFSHWCYGYNTTATLFNASHQIWNLRRLENALLRTYQTSPIPGINRSVLLLGGRTSFFSWHVEDEMLPSVNYLHWGKPKVWYIVHPPFTSMFEDLLKRTYGVDPDIGPCTNPFEHKIWLTDPDFLDRHHIGYSRVSFPNHILTSLFFPTHHQSFLVLCIDYSRAR